MLKRVFLCLFFSLILGIKGQLFCQDMPRPNEESSQNEESISLDKLITAIEVKGNKSISTNTVISKMKIKVGAVYRENIVNDDLKRLYILGFFDDIKIDTEEYKNGLKVIVSVVERPIIEKITFSKMKHLTIKLDKLKNMLMSKEGQYLDYPNLKEDVKILKGLYVKKGFARCEAAYDVKVTPETNKAAVYFDIKEGGRFKIKKIYVEGNYHFSDAKILRIMKTKSAWLFGSGILRQGVLETETLFPGQKVKVVGDYLQGDKERIETFYKNNGFSDVKVSYVVKEDPKKPFFYIHLSIDEGKRYFVGNITIEGNKDISKWDILLRLKACVPGKVFNQANLKDDIVNIQGLYFDRGYIAAQVQETTALNSYSGRIDILYKIVENDIFYVDKIKVSGNVKTKDVVIRRELRIKPGDRFDGEKLKRSKERLQNLGFFEEVSYDTEDSQLSNHKNLVVDVKETKTGAFSFGGGYSTVDQFVGFVEVEQKNFDWKNFPYFTGDGQDLKLRASFGSVSEGYNMSFTDPWIFDYPVSFGFDLYRNTHQRESDIGYGYDEDITGGDGRLGKEISEYVKADLLYRCDNIKITNITENSTQDLKREEGKNIVSSTRFGITYDDRDSVFDPQKGSILSGSLECAGGPFMGDKDYLKLFTRASHYIALPKGVLELRGRLGLADAFGGSEYIPIYEKFFAGGAYTIRGYNERKIGPVDSVSKDPLGGESTLIGNIEYLYPVFDFLKLAVFYDAGNVWEKVGDVGSGGFKSGVGFGLRIKSPIGPIMLDYGVPLEKESGEEEKGSGRFHFSMSHGF